LAAYRVCLDDKGELYWLEQRGGDTIRHDTEPGTTVWQRMSLWFVSLLPLEPLL
ncbi:MAG: phospholipase D family protein, partial [Achromobacter sp.]|nr:phospholipase D family protein [Achromobacter sp.]